MKTEYAGRTAFYRRGPVVLEGYKIYGAVRHDLYLTGAYASQWYA